MEKHQAPSTKHQAPTKTLEHMAFAIGGRLHDDWRKTRLQENGTFEPRWKAVKDEGFAKTLKGDMPSYVRKVEDGYEIDIANASFEQLSKDWQHENLEAGSVVTDIIYAMDLGERIEGNVIGGIIHEKWLERNAYAKGGKLDVPFDKLPKEEQDKDLNQFHVGREVYNEIISNQGHEYPGLNKIGHFTFEMPKGGTDKYDMYPVDKWGVVNGNNLKDETVIESLRNTLKSFGQRVGMTAEQVKAQLQQMMGSQAKESLALDEKGKGV